MMMSDINCLISMQNTKVRKLHFLLLMAKTRLVQAWIEIHRESLLADWDLAVNGQAPFPIDPLR
jgi:hypothetical protein